MKKKSKPKKSQIKTKNKIPVLDPGQDLFDAFETNANILEKQKKTEQIFMDKKRFKKNKHGLPIIEQRTTHEDRITKDPETEFTQLLDYSFKKKDSSVLQNKKKIYVKPTAFPLRKRLKRYPPPQIELDLHGFTAEGAKARVSTFIQNGKRSGFFTARIIVGKGLHSEFGAVLPDIVEDQLRLLKKEDLVLFFEWDKKKKSQSGALIVYIKQFDE
ncbi:MAG: Smr/MutS family protein [Desulfobacteraceae bacterium]|nr:Smr/MutS family protein [Desulfobacteraceae bacterium]